MTEDEQLRQECDTFEIDLLELWPEMDMRGRKLLEAFAKRMIAVGLREALHLADSTDCYTGNKFDLQLFEEQCLVKAKERDR